MYKVNPVIFTKMNFQNIFYSAVLLLLLTESFSQTIIWGNWGYIKLYICYRLLQHIGLKFVQKRGAYESSKTIHGPDGTT